MPKIHDSTRQIWREFSSLISGDPKQLPGIARWISALKYSELRKNIADIRFRTVIIKYGAQNSSVDDETSDTLTFHTGLLKDVGKRWRTWIEEEVKCCTDFASAIGYLQICLQKATGDSGMGDTEVAKLQFYDQIDPIFREWLKELNPEEHDEEYILLLRTKIKQEAMTLGRELIEAAGPKAFSGRYIKEKSGSKEIEKHYSAPEAYNLFLYKLKKILEGG